jgi:hypothetical protein
MVTCHLPTAAAAHTPPLLLLLLRALWETMAAWLSCSMAIQRCSQGRSCLASPNDGSKPTVLHCKHVWCCHVKAPASSLRGNAVGLWSAAWSHARLLPFLPAEQVDQCSGCHPGRVAGAAAGKGQPSIHSGLCQSNLDSNPKQLSASGKNMYAGGSIDQRCQLVLQGHQWLKQSNAIGTT